MRNYYYAKNGEKLGPFTLEEMQKKDLDNDTLVWYEGLEDWMKISNDTELSTLIQKIPPPLRKSGVKKNKSLSITAIAIVAILILFGSFYFYPKWNNHKRFNAALNIFISTDSIQFNEFNYLANNDYEHAPYILGLYYQRTGDSIKAKDSFEKALNSNKRIPALYGLLEVNYKDSSAYLKTISENFQDWLNQIDAKDWLSQKIAAKMFVSGKGTTINYVKAKEYFEKSINNGSISSKILLGNLLSKDGNLKDEAKALELYKSAANLGNPHAMSATGAVYYEGAGVKVDYEEAKKWFWQAAKNNSIYGELYLGLLYMSGDGGKKNYDSAKYWFERAVNNRLDKSETSQGAKVVAQPMLALVKIMKSPSNNTNQKQAETSRSGGSDSFNKYISCDYCGRGFYQKQGFAKPFSSSFSNHCATSWNSVLTDLNLVSSTGYSKDNIQYMINSYERGEWYCTRRCVNESGNCLEDF
jgi:TPR repeat protein